MSYLILLKQEKDGRFSVSVPALPGCFSEGNTLKEAKKNIQEAIKLYLENETFEDQGMQMVATVDVALKR